MKCKDCKYWDFQCPKDPPDTIDDGGWCRRNAPPASVTHGDPNHANNSVAAVWPWTDETDWCGEFKPKEKEYKPGPGAHA